MVPSFIHIWFLVLLELSENPSILKQTKTKKKQTKSMSTNNTSSSEIKPKIQLHFRSTIRPLTLAEKIDQIKKTNIVFENLTYDQKLSELKRLENVPKQIEQAKNSEAFLFVKKTNTKTTVQVTSNQFSQITKRKSEVLEISNTEPKMKTKMIEIMETKPKEKKKVVVKKSKTKKEQPKENREKNNQMSENTKCRKAIFKILKERKELILKQSEKPDLKTEEINEPINKRPMSENFKKNQEKKYEEALKFKPSFHSVSFVSALSDSFKKPQN
jgi:hypothetical protein